jgi:hypothetical protein
MIPNSNDWTTSSSFMAPMSSVSSTIASSRPAPPAVSASLVGTTYPPGIFDDETDELNTSEAPESTKKKRPRPNEASSTVQEGKQRQKSQATMFASRESVAQNIIDGMYKCSMQAYKDNLKFGLRTSPTFSSLFLKPAPDSRVYPSWLETPALFRDQVRVSYVFLSFHLASVIDVSLFVLGRSRSGF